jgi:hypothetical protein
MADLLRLEELSTWFAELLPVRGGRVELQAALQGDGSCVVEGAEGGLSAIFHLVVYEQGEGGGRYNIVSIKEQPVFVVGAEHRDEPERVRAFIEAWVSIMPEVLGRIGDEAETIIPSDLVDFSPLALARATTCDDFQRALRAKGRYGRLLTLPRPAPTPRVVANRGAPVPPSPKNTTVERNLVGSLGFSA